MPLNIVFSLLEALTWVREEELKAALISRCVSHAAIILFQQHNESKSEYFFKQKKLQVKNSAFYIHLIVIT